MPSDRPNILFILADDLGWGDVSYHGSVIRTPNIDRLVETGVELDQHYVNPMCTPTRVSLLTGRYPGRFGEHTTVPANEPALPDGYETLANSMRNAGYDTGLFGKWHLGSSPEFGPNAFGFDASYGSLADGVDPYNHRYKRGPFSYTWHRNGERVDERGHVTDLIVREAAQWIEGRDKPWFCYVPFTAVHVPVKVPQAWADRYQYERYDDNPEKDRSFRAYAAYASQMDHGIGLLIDALQRTGQHENTIVVFSSDNGALHRHSEEDASQYPGFQTVASRLGSNLPLRGQKATMYEGGIRTPTAINWPGVLEPSKVVAPMHAVDWMPTITSLVGYTPSDDPQWDGQDVWSAIEGKEPTGDRTMYWNFRWSTEFAMREGDMKLITYRRDGEYRDTQLYDLGNDPYETTDLASNRPDIVERLMSLMNKERELDGSSKRPDIK